MIHLWKSSDGHTENMLARVYGCVWKCGKPEHGPSNRCVCMERSDDVKGDIEQNCCEHVLIVVKRRWRNWVSGSLQSAMASILVNGSPTEEFNDAIFVESWSKKNMDDVVNLLHVFHLASRMSINLQKSKLLGFGVHSHDIQQMTMCIGVNLPFGYLGLLMGENMTRVKAWKCVVDKVTSKLSNWKTKTLSNDGRLTLLKSVLGETPTY
ncbi:hypothetical protein Tco_0044657 [Tanacetum coccineum]